MPADQRPLEETGALVTGASSGIGAATATALAEEGAAVALAARREDRLRDLADQIDANGGSAVVIPTDVTDRDQVETMVETATQEVGLDVLVNNAGVMRSAPLDRADLADLRRMIDVNLFGVMATTREALPSLTADDGGHVVNVSSVAAIRPESIQPGYAATKAGVDAFTEALRKDLVDTDVRVTVVRPGGTQTELGTSITDEATIEQLRTMIRETTFMDPIDVAASILHAVVQPPYASVNELVVRPTDQEW